MSATDVLTLVLSALAIIVTVALYVTNQVNARQIRRASDRARVVDLVLTAAERSVRSFGRPGLLRLWGSPETDAALVIPRLIAQLGSQHTVVQQWVTSEVGRQLRETDRKKALEIQTHAAFQLLAWDRGSVKDSWFADQLASLSAPVALEVSPAVTRVKSRRLAVRVFLEAAGLSVVVALLGRLWRQF